MDKTVLYNLSYGLYAIGVKDGNRNCGCIVNTVFQVSNDGPLIAVSLNKDNYTTNLIKKNRFFSITILSEKTTPKVIQELGFQSGKTIDKWDSLSFIEVNDLPIVKEHCNGYLICEYINELDANTHELILAKVIDANHDCDIKPMTYAYYHEKLKGKAPKNAPTYREPQVENNQWVCTICGYVYEGDHFEDEPHDYTCPICKAPKDMFKLKESQS